MGFHLLGAKIGAQHIGLGLFQRKGFVTQCFHHSSFSVDGLLHTQGLGHLTEHDTPVESIGIQMGAILAFQQLHAGRENGAVELLADDIVKEDGTGTILPLDTGIVGEIHGNGLVTGIGITAVV